MTVGAEDVKLISAKSEITRKLIFLNNKIEIQSKRHTEDQEKAKETS